VKVFQTLKDCVHAFFITIFNIICCLAFFSIFGVSYLRIIIEKERKMHFTIYTCINTRKINNLQANLLKLYKKYALMKKILIFSI